MLRELFDLRDTWLNRPQDRPDLDTAMTDHATSVLGDHPENPLTVTV